jgi:hypothetical protein
MYFNLILLLIDKFHSSCFINLMNLILLNKFYLKKTMIGKRNKNYVSKQILYIHQEHYYMNNKPILLDLINS